MQVHDARGSEGTGFARRQAQRARRSAWSALASAAALDPLAARRVTPFDEARRDSVRSAARRGRPWPAGPVHGWSARARAGPDGATSTSSPSRTHPGVHRARHDRADAGQRESSDRSPAGSATGRRAAAAGGASSSRCCRRVRRRPPAQRRNREDRPACSRRLGEPARRSQRAPRRHAPASTASILVSATAPRVTPSSAECRGARRSAASRRRRPRPRAARSRCRWRRPASCARSARGRARRRSRASSRRSERHEGVAEFDRDAALASPPAGDRCRGPSARWISEVLPWSMWPAVPTIMASRPRDCGEQHAFVARPRHRTSSQSAPSCDASDHGHRQVAQRVRQRVDRAPAALADAARSTSAADGSRSTGRLPEPIWLAQSRLRTSNPAPAHRSQRSLERARTPRGCRRAGA